MTIPWGHFGGQVVIGEVIAGILRGAMRGGDLDRVFRDNYRRPRQRADIDFGGWPRGPSWPSPWSGGGTGSRGGFGTGGGGVAGVPAGASESRRLDGGKRRTMGA